MLCPARRSSHGALSPAKRPKSGVTEADVSGVAPTVFLQLHLYTRLSVFGPCAEPREIQHLLLGWSIRFSDTTAIQRGAREAAHRVDPPRSSPARFPQPLHPLSPAGEHRNLA